MLVVWKTVVRGERAPIPGQVAAAGEGVTKRNQYLFRAINILTSQDIVKT